VQKIGRSNDAARQKRNRNSEFWLWSMPHESMLLLPRVRRVGWLGNLPSLGKQYFRSNCKKA